MGKLATFSNHPKDPTFQGPTLVWQEIQRFGINLYFIKDMSRDSINQIDAQKYEGNRR